MRLLSSQGQVRAVHQTLSAGGRGRNSLLIDCDGGFQPHEFNRLLRARVRAVLSREEQPRPVRRALR